jgi:hypothetical protein
VWINSGGETLSFINVKRLRLAQHTFTSHLAEEAKIAAAMVEVDAKFRASPSVLARSAPRKPREPRYVMAMDAQRKW